MKQASSCYHVCYNSCKQLDPQEPLFFLSLWKLIRQNICIENYKVFPVEETLMKQL